MSKKTMLMSMIILILLLSGCEAGLSGAAAASATPTIVSLPAVTETAGTPTPRPTASAIPAPSATPMAALSVATQPTSAATTAVPAATGQLAQASGPESATPTASLNGTWDFTFGTMSLTQQGSRVEGAYQWYGGGDTGQIDGIVSEELNQFQGLWISDRNPNSQSLLRWRLAADRQSFTGNFESGRGGQWCGVRTGQTLTAGCGFSGVWQLRFGSPPGVTGQAVLTQIGQTVQGTYTDSRGHTGEIVNGLITVNSLTEVKLTGTWRNDQGEQDTFEWRLDLTTGRTFQGRRNPGNSEWCGWRLDADEPAQCGWQD